MLRKKELVVTTIEEHLLIRIVLTMLGGSSGNKDETFAQAIWKANSKTEFDASKLKLAVADYVEGLSVPKRKKLRNLEMDDPVDFNDRIGESIRKVTSESKKGRSF